MVILRPDLPNDRKPPKTSFNPVSGFAMFFMLGSILGIAAGYMEQSFASFAAVQNSFMLIYCALCLREIIIRMNRHG